jgi:hypothetical protein
VFLFNFRIVKGMVFWGQYHISVSQHEVFWDHWVAIIMVIRNVCMDVNIQTGQTEAFWFNIHMIKSILKNEKCEIKINI